MQRGKAWITVQELGSGWAAVLWHMAEEDGCTFPEPWDTGMGRYASYTEAMPEARRWADAEGVPFIGPEMDNADIARYIGVQEDVA